MFKRKAGFTYIALWSYKIEFVLPNTKEKAVFSINPPNEFPFNSFAIVFPIPFDAPVTIITLFIISSYERILYILLYSFWAFFSTKRDNKSFYIKVICFFFPVTACGFCLFF